MSDTKSFTSQPPSSVPKQNYLLHLLYYNLKFTSIHQIYHHYYDYQKQDLIDFIKHKLQHPNTILITVTKFNYIKQFYGPAYTTYHSDHH